MQRHAGHFLCVSVSDPLRQTARDDVAVANRLHFVHAEVLDAFVERTRDTKFINRLMKLYTTTTQLNSSQRA